MFRSITVVVLQTIQKNQTQTLENVLMKTSAKLGGVSHIVKTENGEYLPTFQNNR